MLSVSTQTTPTSPNAPGVTHVTVDFEVGYDFGQTVLDLDDVVIRTDPSGNLEWSTDIGSDFTDLFDLTRSDLESVEINIRYNATSNSDFQQLVQNLFNAPIATAFVSNLWAPGVDISVNAFDIEVLSGATLSTRELSPGTPNQLTDDSIGDSGNLTLNAPRIKVGSGAQTPCPRGPYLFRRGRHQPALDRRPG